MDAAKLTAEEKAALAIMQYPSMLFVSDHLTEEFAYTEEIASNLV